MQIEFDALKDKQNSSKHGVSLKFAEQLAWDEAYVWVDPRYTYDELRMIGLVPEGTRCITLPLLTEGTFAESSAYVWLKDER